jgi:hypothetical protein
MIGVLLNLRLTGIHNSETRTCQKGTFRIKVPEKTEFWFVNHFKMRMAQNISNQLQFPLKI